MRAFIAGVLGTIAFVAVPSSALAASCTANADGNWTAATTWSNCPTGVAGVAGIPGVADTASVAGHVIAIDQNVSVAGLTLDNATLNDSGGNTINGHIVSILLGGATVTGSGVLQSSGTGLSIAGALTLTETNPGNSLALTASGPTSWTVGAITLTGGATFSQTASTFTTTGTLAGTADAASQFSLGGTTAVSAGAVTLTGPVQVGGSLNLAGALTLDGAIVVSGVNAVAGAGSLSLTGTLSIPNGNRLNVQAATTLENVAIAGTGGTVIAATTASGILTVSGATTSSGTGTITISADAKLQKPVYDVGLTQLTFTITSLAGITAPAPVMIDGGTLAANFTGLLWIHLAQGAQVSDRATTGSLADGSIVDGPGIFGLAASGNTSVRASTAPNNSNIAAGHFTPGLLDLGAGARFTINGATSTVKVDRILVNNNSVLTLNSAIPSGQTINPPFHVAAKIVGIHGGQITGDLFTDIDVSGQAILDSASIGVPITTHGATNLTGNTTLDASWTVPTKATLTTTPGTTVDGIGRILLAGGAMMLGGDLELAGLVVTTDPSAPHTGGSLDLAGHTIAIALGIGTLRVDAGGTVTGSGTIDASVGNVGTLAPTGPFTVTGKLTTTGTLSASSNVHVMLDALLLGGNVTVHGQLTVDGATSESGGTVAVVDGATESGDLTVNGASLTAGSITVHGVLMATTATIVSTGAMTADHTVTLDTSTLSAGALTATGDLAATTSPMTVTGPVTAGAGVTLTNSALTATSLAVTGDLNANGKPVLVTGPVAVGKAPAIHALTLTDAPLSAASLAVTGDLSAAGATTITVVGAAGVGGNLTMSGDTGSLSSAGLTVGHDVVARATFTINGALSVAGTLTGTGHLTLTLPVTPASRIVGSATLSSALLDLHGNLRVGTYSQDATSTLGVSVRSATATDQLTSDGSTTLDGTLSVTSTGYDPAPGATSRVISSGPVTGTFATLTAPLTDGRNWQIVDYAATPVTLSLHYSAPGMLAAPTITGTPVVGQSLTCTDGTWSGRPLSFAYAFGEPTALSTPPTTMNTVVITLAMVGKDIGCAVSATNPASTVTIASSNVLVVRPALTAPPSVGPGASVLGAALTCSPGVWAGSTSFTYQWLRDGVTITGQTTQAYTAGIADLTHLLSCQVTASGVSNTSNTVLTPPARVVTGLVVAGTKLDKTGKLAFSTTCIAAEGSCTGTITVTVGGKVVATVAVSGAGKRVAKVKLPAALKKRLAAGKTIAASLAFVYHDAGGNVRSYALPGKLHR